MPKPIRSMATVVHNVQKPAGIGGRDPRGARSALDTVNRSTGTTGHLPSAQTRQGRRSTTGAIATSGSNGAVSGSVKPTSAPPPAALRANTVPPWRVDDST